MPCFISMAWKWFCTADVRLGAISSSTSTWVHCTVFTIYQPHVSARKTVIAILALAQVGLGHQLVVVLHVQVFIAHLQENMEEESHE